MDSGTPRRGEWRGLRTIQRLEAGSDASLESLSRIADALQVGVKDLFISMESTGMAEAVEGLDERRLVRQRHDAALASRRRVTSTSVIGWAAAAVGALCCAAALYPDNGIPYLIGGLIAITAGLRMIHRMPSWPPIALAWISAAVIIVWMGTFSCQWWLLGCSAVIFIAAAAVFTWLSVHRPEQEQS